MSTVAARGDEKYEFRIREDTLGSALDAIVRQTNLVVLYPYELADKTGINPVFGRYTVREALAILLRGTKFSGGLTESGTMFVALSGDSKATDREDQVAGGKIKNGLLASAAAFLMPTAGHAAQDVAEADAAREEIIVTARRKEENLQEVPVAVTALNQDALDRLVVNTLDDLNKLAPGLQLGGCIGRTNCGPNIRAQGSSVAAGTTSVVSYFAEVPNFQTSFFDLENIQVLKGPQGTLFGETATGGAILYTPRKPTNEFSAHLGAQLGNYDFKQFDAAIGGPIIDDKLMVRVAGRWRKRDGVTTAFFSDGSAPQHIDDVDEAQWRASIVWKPTDSIENYTIYAGSHYSRRGTSHILAYVDPRFMPVSRRNQIPASNAQLAAAYELYTGSPPPAGMSWTQIAQAALLRQNAAGPRTVFANYDLSTSGNFNGVVNQTRWDILDNLTFRNIFGLFWSKTPGSNTTGSNYDGLDAPIFESRGVVLPGSTSPNTNWGRLGGWPSRDWSEEAQLLGTLFDGRIDWQGGFYYRVTASRDYETATGNVVFAAFSGDPAPVSFCDEAGVASPCSRARRNEGKNYAVYGQATFAVTEEFNLTGGFRHTWDTTTAFEAAAPTQYLTFKGFPFPLQVEGIEPIPGAKEVATVYPLTQANTYTVTADWKVSDAVLLYLAHRTGYTRGGINRTALIGDPARTFLPERIKDIEFGVKADWSLGDITGRTNLAAYRNWYTDVQRNEVRPGTSFTVIQNVGEIIIQGLELENAVSLTDWLELRTDLGYIDAYYTKWSENTTCSGQPYRPPCAAGLPGSTPFVVDHANGVITGLGAPIYFTPDRYRGGTAKWNASIQPTVHLTPWIGEDISLGANIRYKSSYANFSTSSSYLAGMTPVATPNVFGVSDPFITPGYTLIDLQADWRNVADSRVSLAARVTNLTDKLYNMGSALGAITTSGTAVAVAGEPRIWFVELRVDM